MCDYLWRWGRCAVGAREQLMKVLSLGPGIGLSSRYLCPPTELLHSLAPPCLLLTGKITVGLCDIEGLGLKSGARELSHKVLA